MKLFLVAGEASGDRLGGALMAGLREVQPDIAFDGVGGDAMQAQGLTSRFPMEELSVMGLTEVLPRYFDLRRRLIQTADAVIETQPDALITIDSPDFGLRVAARVRAAAPEIRTVHYVAPSVWAWRPGRAEKMARHIDQVLTLLPFEPPYMDAAGMRADFVGHPVVSEPVATDREAEAFRSAHGIGDAPLLLVLPGSRMSEVSKLLPVFAETVRRLAREVPRLRIVVPAASGVADTVRRAGEGWPGTPVVLMPRDTDAATKRAAFRAADTALAASGTVSLELAAAETPMVIAYDFNWLTWQIMRRMVRVDTVTLVNLVSDTRVVPEFLGPACEPGPIAGALVDLMGDATLRARQLDAMRTTMDRLGRGGEAPGLRAARAVLDGLSQAAAD